MKDYCRVEEAVSFRGEIIAGKAEIDKVLMC